MNLVFIETNILTEFDDTVKVDIYACRKVRDFAIIDVSRVEIFANRRSRHVLNMYMPYNLPTVSGTKRSNSYFFN